MSWVVALRNELWANYPALYTVIAILVATALLRYVYKHEVRMNEQAKRERRPFK